MAPHSQPTRQLGKDGPQITAMGLGMMGLSFAYGSKLPDDQRHALLTHAYETGCLNWDSADIYGDSEDLLNAWFKANPGKRDNIFLATKFANVMKSDGSRYVDSSPEYVKQACEKSLQRLGLPYVDLYYCHRLDRKTPIEKTVQAMKELKDEGKIKYLGLSECSSESLRRAHKVHPISAVQIEYSPIALDIETEQVALLKTCRELGVATIAYSPIGRGLVTGAIKSRDDLPENDFRRMAPRFSEENFHKNIELTNIIVGLADKKGCTATQLTLAWLMAQGDDIIPIPGTTKKERLDENMGSLKITLTKDENAEIRKACENAEIQGTRYPEAFMAACFADTPPLGA